MAFSKKNFSGNIGAGSSSISFYVHKDTASTKAQVAAADYFLPITGVLKANDGIVCACSDGSIILFVVSATALTVTTELLEVTTA
jgi:hypothetical protein